MTTPKTTCVCSSRDLFNHGCRCVISKKFQIWHNGVDWVCARDIEEARDLVKSWTGCLDDEIDGDEGWAPVPDDKELTFHDGPDDDSITKLPAKDWVAEINKPEYMGSTEF